MMVVDMMHPLDLCLHFFVDHQDHFLSGDFLWSGDKQNSGCPGIRLRPG